MPSGGVHPITTYRRSGVTNRCDLPERRPTGSAIKSGPTLAAQLRSFPRWVIPLCSLPRRTCFDGAALAHKSNRCIVDKYRAAKAIERLMFVVLLCTLSAGGFSYSHLRGELPDWKLVGLIVVGYIVAFGFCRLALRLALSKLYN